MGKKPNIHQFFALSFPGTVDTFSLPPGPGFCPASGSYFLPTIVKHSPGKIIPFKERIVSPALEHLSNRWLEPVCPASGLKPCGGAPFGYTLVYI